MHVEKKVEKNYQFLTNTSRNNEKHVDRSEASQNAGFRSFHIPVNNRFYKAERLKSSATISGVFANGLSVANYPIIAYYLQEQQLPEKNFLAQAAFTVSKKRFSKAVDRNRIKRLMREAYRLNKLHFYQLNEKHHHYKIVFVYIGKEIANYAQIQASISKILGKIVSA